MEFQLRYFKSWKMMLWKCCTQYASKFGKLSSGYRTEEVRIHSSLKERQCQKCSNYCTVALISHTSKVMLKILQARFQQNVNWELPDVQAGFREGRWTRGQIANICWIIKKQENFRKTSISAIKPMLKPLTVWITANCGKFLEMGKPDPLSCLLRNLCAGQETTVRTGHGTMDWFRIRKGVCQSCILSPCLFNLCAEYIMWNAGLDEAQSGIQIAGRNINNLRQTDDTTLWQKVKRN